MIETQQQREARLIAEHDGRIRALVNWLRRDGSYSHLDREDMEQEARMVLLRRIRTYREGTGASVWTYARPNIIGYFLDKESCRSRRRELEAERGAEVFSWNAAEDEPGPEQLLRVPALA